MIGEERHVPGEAPGTSPGGGHHNIPRRPAKKTLRFDVTDELRALGGDVASSGLSVVIEATDGRVTSDPAKADELRQAASQKFRAEAKVRIGSIELQAVPPPKSPPKK
jgi:hypothetical protein